MERLDPEGRVLILVLAVPVVVDDDDDGDVVVDAAIEAASTCLDCTVCDAAAGGGRTADVAKCAGGGV